MTLYRDACEADRRGETAVAIQLLERAIAQAPHARYYHHLAVLLARASLFDRAIQMIEAADRLTPDDPLIQASHARILGAAAMRDTGERRIKRCGFLRRFLRARRATHSPR